MNNTEILKDTLEILHSVYSDLINDLDFKEPSHVMAFTKTAQSIGSLTCQLEAMELNRLELISKKKNRLAIDADRDVLKMSPLSEEEIEHAEQRLELFNSSIEAKEDSLLLLNE